MSDNKNRRPEESSKLPYVSLLVLVLMIAGLLYVGYEYIADDAADVDELLNTPIDTSGRELQPLPSDDQTLALPETVESVSGDTKKGSEAEHEIKNRTNKEADNVATDVAEDTKPAEKSKPSAVDVGGVEITHTVQDGETFYAVANRYNLKTSTLKGLNPNVQDNNVKSGVTQVKVRVQAIHTVGAGDILRVVAQKYGITVQQLMAANKKTKNYAERGEKLIIPFPEKK